MSRGCCNVLQCTQAASSILPTKSFTKFQSELVKSFASLPFLSQPITPAKKVASNWVSNIYFMISVG